MRLSALSALNLTQRLAWSLTQSFIRSLIKSPVQSIKQSLLWGLTLVCTLSCSVLSALFISCDAPRDGTPLAPLTAPELPELSLTAPTRGAFLGVWGAERDALDAIPEPERERRVWFVGGTSSAASSQAEGGSSSLIAVYEPDGDTDSDSTEQGESSLSSGVLRLHHEEVGGALWWVWGSGRRGEVWASGEGGALWRLDALSDMWVKEPVMMEPELLEKLVIWGIWGMRDARGQLRVWAVGGSVRRGGPRGVLLSRSPEGTWTRVEHQLLPREDRDDPLVGTNLYKMWGHDDQVWLVGEGSLTLTARVTDGTLSEWRAASLLDATEDQRPQLLFTVSGAPAPDESVESVESAEPTRSTPPVWVVGGYDRALAWRWGEAGSSSGDESGWRALELPTTPALNGVHVSTDFTLAVGQRGTVSAWRSQTPLNDPELIAQRRVRGAEHMTLHSVWRDRRGGYWVAGGDLTTLSEGIILSPEELPSPSSSPGGEAQSETQSEINSDHNLSVRRDRW